MPGSKVWKDVYRLAVGLQRVAEAAAAEQSRQFGLHGVGSLLPRPLRPGGIDPRSLTSETSPMSQVLTFTTSHIHQMTTSHARNPGKAHSGNHTFGSERTEMNIQYNHRPNPPAVAPPPSGAKLHHPDSIQEQAEAKPGVEEGPNMADPEEMAQALLEDNKPGEPRGGRQVEIERMQVACTATYLLNAPLEEFVDNPDPAEANVDRVMHSYSVASAMGEHGGELNPGLKIAVDKVLQKLRRKEADTKQRRRPQSSSAPSQTQLVIQHYQTLRRLARLKVPSPSKSVQPSPVADTADTDDAADVDEVPGSGTPHRHRHHYHHPLTSLLRKRERVPRHFRSHQMLSRQSVHPLVQVAESLAQIEAQVAAQVGQLENKLADGLEKVEEAMNDSIHKGKDLIHEKVVRAEDRLEKGRELVRAKVGQAEDHLADRLERVDSAVQEQLDKGRHIPEMLMNKVEKIEEKLVESVVPVVAQIKKVIRKRKPKIWHFTRQRAAEAGKK